MTPTSSPPPAAGVAGDQGAAAEVDFEALFQRAPCGYLTTTDDGTITGVNDTFLQWTGRRRHDLLGSRLHQLMPVGDRILYTTHCVPQLMLVGASTEILIEIVGADGAHRAALLTAARSPAGDGGPGVVRVIIVSAHERRRYEQELVTSLRRAEAAEALRVSAEADLAHLALHDPLTGLPNRAQMAAYLHDALTRRVTTAAGVGVLSINLDHFRAVNDSLGSAAGDELLRIVADRLCGSVRETGMVARMSGDGFVVVDDLPNTEQASALAQRLLDVLDEPLILEGLEVLISGSIGVAVSVRDGDTVEGLLRSAEVAMYRAKAGGRGRWSLHDPARSDPAINRLRLIGELRRGIRDGELRLHYQPRIQLRTGLLHGVEALVRWDHPTQGLLSPGAFMEAAEGSGLIHALGAWVLETAIAQAARWPAAGPDGAPVEMAVNLSTRQLSDPHLAELVTDALHRHRVTPSALTLELTETALMQDPDAALRTLTALHGLGVKLAVDDFGTGYASLTYLQRFPIDEIKIDQSFVSGLAADTADSTIVATCIQLAHAMGIRALAEGVETEAQRRTLLELNCDLAQGYLYSRPLTADELTEWMSERLAGSRSTRS